MHVASEMVVTGLQSVVRVHADEFTRMYLHTYIFCCMHWNRWVYAKIVRFTASACACIITVLGGHTLMLSAIIDPA